jgi:hypothetical protein
VTNLAEGTLQVVVFVADFGLLGLEPSQTNRTIAADNFGMYAWADRPICHGGAAQETEVIGICLAEFTALLMSGIICSHIIG